MPNLTLPAPAVVVPDVLTSALIGALPGRIGGIAHRESALVVKLVGADATDAERTTITTIVAAHDGQAFKNAVAQRLAAANAEATLNVLARKSIAEIDAYIEALASAADLKTALKQLARFVKALDWLRTSGRG